MHFTHSTLYTTHCTLHNAHYTLHTAHYTLHNKQCTLQTAIFTMHALNPTLYTLHPILNTQNSALNTGVFAVGTFQRRQRLPLAMIRRWGVAHQRQWWRSEKQHQISPCEGGHQTSSLPRWSFLSWQPLLWLSLMSTTRTGHGLDMNWTWTGHGLDMDWTWTGHGLDSWCVGCTHHWTLHIAVLYYILI